MFFVNFNELTYGDTENLAGGIFSAIHHAGWWLWKTRNL
jgi:hypothetical protein